ncbi:alpha/beta hydrolase [Oleomonas cavernae]|uniref:Alpha/beta hydrolase n=1 Tax=Oleomonas cavernae TaxID=2320859 RepID=A0A418WEU4_9PROT|nr:alpha/beta hydrolase [Oleomonas cavernae]RJF88545.1 alpha/beta hydrolase [Oleomonas cavernae]
MKSFAALALALAILGFSLLAGGPAGAAADLPPGSRVERDVAYGPDPAQRMDIYLPARPRQAPVLLMVHGGGWFRGDKAMGNVVANKVARWLPQGIIVISVNNRLVPEADPVEQADDIALALAFAQARAPSWGGDPARFVLMGHSAGAHLVALLAADPAIAARRGARPWLGTIPLDSAAYDVARIMNARHFKLYDRAFGDDPAFWQQASPFHRLAGRPAPLLLVCSSRRAVSCAQARGFAEKVTSMGARATVLPVDLSHGAINQELGLPGDYTDAVEAFMRSLGILPR